MRRVRCKCRTSWIVDFGDDRGVQSVTGTVAARAHLVGLPVSLGKVSSTPFSPLIIEGLQYSGAREYVAKMCNVCGWPTLMKRNTVASC